MARIETLCGENSADVQVTFQIKGLFVPFLLSLMLRLKRPLHCPLHIPTFKWLSFPSASNAATSLLPSVPSSSQNFSSASSPLSLACCRCYSSSWCSSPDGGGNGDQSSMLHPRLRNENFMPLYGRKNDGIGTYSSIRHV